MSAFKHGKYWVILNLYGRFDVISYDGEIIKPDLANDNEAREYIDGLQ